MTIFSALAPALGSLNVDVQDKSWTPLNLENLMEQVANLLQQNHQSSRFFECPLGF